MAPDDVTILKRENPFEDHWMGWALKIEAFLGPEMAMSKASAIWDEVNLLCPARWVGGPIQPFVQNNKEINSDMKSA
jgi:hypothetical protein